ncbi:echinoderm microtubule-associated protein-like 2 isoform X2 [Gigantopelta aegis]|uniref:echinoderm microtubule-associated protein-like 2 isoform X2 n=1 Tax=Gigantopelta aegis TaxID=1735272 RepID=UPI001B88A08B|nr:echinoderm microtubule-associated protein-like 2 isoform X2 [Gigantopelta aegis]
MNTSLRAQARRDRNAAIGQRGTTQSNSGNSLDTLNSKRERSPSPYGRRSPRIADTPVEDIIVDILPSEHVDPKEKLEKALKDALEQYSRQRLRAVHMSLRRYGNVEARISQKDLLQALQENEVNLSNRLFQMILEIFEDHVGVDYEDMYKCLTAAHDKTNRDSVKARRLRNDLSAHADVSLEKQDAEFLRRIEEMLIKNKVFFDIDALRKDFQSWDSTRTGKIAKESILMVCNDRTPLYGALLKNLVKRCDVEKNGQVSWPEFINFLDKGQQRAWLKFPELSKLPEKAKQESKFTMNQNPIEELSTNARSRVVSKLLRRREKSTLSNSDKITSKEKSDLKKEKANVSAENSSKENAEGDSSAKTSKKKLVETEQVPIIEVENPSEASGDSEVKVDTDKPKVNVSPAANGVSGSGDVSTGSSAETTSGKEKKKPAEVNKSSSENKRNDKDKSKESKNASSENTSKSNDKKEELKETKSTTEKKQEKTNNKVKEEKPEVESDPEPELTSPNDVIVNIHEKNVRVFRPSSYKDNNLPIDPPRERLQLDWIYGYRGHDCRMNIHVLANQEIAYFLANTVILYNLEAHTQRHYREHTEDIKCMAVHTNGNIIATGQCASKSSLQQNTANVRIWRADTLQTMYTLGSGMFTKAVMSVAFPKDTDLVAAVDLSQDKQLTVWDVTDGKLVANTFINIDVVCAIGFNPADPNLLVTVGKEHIGWWKVYAETHTIQKFANPDYENYLRARFVICLTHNEKGDLITGDSNGTIYIWGGGGHKITNFVKHSHECPIFTVLYYRHHVLSGGRDGTLQCWQWNKNMDNAGSMELPKSEGGVRMLHVYKESLLIGTTMNSILSVTLAEKGSPLEDVELHPQPITQGHFDDVRGLQKIPKSFIGADFLTAGVDGVISKFSTENHQPVWKIVMKDTTFLCVDCSTEGKLLAFGTHDGHLILLELNPDDLSVTEAFNMKLTKERLDTVKLSPDCLSVAIGGHDKAIYIFSLVEREDVGKVWEMQGKCKGHRGAVTAMDWSAERLNGDYYIRSSSSSCDQRFWNVAKLEAVQGSVCENIQWASDRCIIDHKLTGLWGSKQGKEGMIHSVDINPPKTVVAIGDSNGHLSLFRYPCSKSGVFSHTYRCHHGVHNTCFSPSGNYVLSVGGKDSCVMQWKVV